MESNMTELGNLQTTVDSLSRSIFSNDLVLLTRAVHKLQQLLHHVELHVQKAMHSNSVEYRLKALKLSKVYWEVYGDACLLLPGTEMLNEAVEAYSRAIAAVKLEVTQGKDKAEILRTMCKLRFQKGVALSFGQRYAEALAEFDKSFELSGKAYESENLMEKKVLFQTRCQLTRAFCTIANYQYQAFAEMQKLPAQGISLELAEKVLGYLDSARSLSNSLQNNGKSVNPSEYRSLVIRQIGFTRLYLLWKLKKIDQLGKEVERIESSFAKSARENHDILLCKAMFLEHAQNYDEALKIYEKLRSLPDKIHLFRNISRSNDPYCLYEMFAKFTRVSCWNDLGVSKSLREARILIKQAKCLQNSKTDGHEMKAIDIYMEILELKTNLDASDLRVIYRGLIKLNNEIENFHNAEMCCYEYIKILDHQDISSNAFCRFNLGWIYFRTDRAEECSELMEQIIDMYQKHKQEVSEFIAKAYHLQALVCEQQSKTKKDHRKSLDLLSKSIKLETKRENKLEAFLNKAVILMGMGEYFEALEECDNALDIEDSPNVNKMKAECYHRLGYAKQSLEILRRLKQKQSAGTEETRISAQEKVKQNLKGQCSQKQLREYMARFSNKTNA